MVNGDSPSGHFSGRYAYERFVKGVHNRIYACVTVRPEFPSEPILKTLGVALRRNYSNRGSFQYETLYHLDNVKAQASRLERYSVLMYL